MKRHQAGTSLVEIMIAMALGLIILTALASVFANSSRQRSEMERSSRQIENGRYAMELLTEDLRMAGFYGEVNGKQPMMFSVPGTLLDPCSANQADWVNSVTIHVQRALGSCGAFYPNTNSEYVVVRRVSTCEAGVGGCAAYAANKAYLQASKCATELALANGVGQYRFGVGIGFDRTLKDCTTRAGLRQYMVRAYYISDRNGQGNNNMPTLYRTEFDGVAQTVVPLVEGIERVHFEYGIDWDNDGAPNGYTADPSTYAPAACPTGSCGAALNWANVVTVRVYVLSRSIDATPNWTDPKTYNLGNDAAGNPISVTPGGPYKRSVYTGLVRVVNAAERRDSP